MSIGYLGAFLGGFATLLSPCSALLLPAFFAYAFSGTGRLLGRTLVFYLGLAVVLVPLGVGAAWASRLVYGHQVALATIAGAALLALGFAQIAGVRLFTGRLGRLRGAVRGDSPPAVFLLGALSGLAGSCTGPILGGVLTVAAVSGQAAQGAALLAVYAAGMAAPLFLLAALWDRFELGRRRWLRGRGFRLGPLHLHTTNLAAGLVLVALGLLILRYRTPAALTDLLKPPSALTWETILHDLILRAQAHVGDLALLAALAGAVIAVTLWRLRRTARRTARQEEAPSEPERRPVRGEDPNPPETSSSPRGPQAPHRRRSQGPHPPRTRRG